MLKCVDVYISKVKQEGTEKKYMKSSSNFFGKDRAFEDYLKTEVVTKPKYKIIDTREVEVLYAIDEKGRCR